MNQLRHDDVSRQIAETQQALARNADIQALTVSNLQNAGDRMAAAVTAEFARMPEAWQRFTGEQRQLMQDAMGNLTQGQQQ